VQRATIISKLNYCNSVLATNTQHLMPQFKQRSQQEIRTRYTTPEWANPGSFTTDTLLAMCHHTWL